uniref:Death-inducer obliterator 1 n=1 Tax=Ursus maritimus TaxID=29073 RepID=A0A452VBQ0_URSMA
MDEKGDPSNDEVPKAIKPTSKEFRKTWGFRRTTIAKREGAGDAELDSLEQQPQQQQQSLSLRRSGRQPKRTERVEEFLTTVRRRGRKNAPVSLEDSSEPASCPVTDVETASEGSVESTSEGKGGPTSGSTGDKERPAASAKAKGGEDEDDTSDSDSDGLTLKELQNRLRRQREQEAADRPPKSLQSRLRKKRREQDPTQTVDVETGNATESVLPRKQEPEAEQGTVSQAEKDGGDRELEGKAAQGIEGGDPGDVGRQKPECEAYEPNALYCICRQPHNNRFMICCDRCEEWFHGDCVGISEARGRLLERNGEDYICPNCTILQVQDETNSESTEQQEAKCGPADADGTDCTSIGTVEQKSSEDQGIKGRIEKAANPSGKKKLKIFQPVVEAPGASKCIGPGCSNVAQPDSVYCSSDCILKHAAATMKFLSSGKEQKPKPKEKAKTKPEKLILPKCSVQAGFRIAAVHKRPAPDKKENTVKKAMVAPSRSEVLVKEATSEGTPSWASDHNYNAVKPEQTAALWPPLLYKSAKEDRRVEERTTAPKKMAPAGPSASGRQPPPRNLLSKKSPPFANAAAAKVPNSQIRQNIRRSLKEILWKRVNDSDDLIMTESEVGKIALHIEKEMFNLFQVTDNRYKSKYRSIMFNLKDPKNQGLFHRVLREEISLAKLVRMKPEELVSKELSTWRERPTRPVMESRNKLHSENKKTAAKQEPVPDMEDSPPVSDSDEQQESVRAVPEKSAAPLLDVFSSMLKDTTGQHRAHLFDLNCKICTGQVPSSEDEPAPKKQKLSASKKEESKPKCETSPSEPVLSSADEAVPEALPENASEPDLESASHAHLERKYFPVPPGDSLPEPSALEGPSCPATCGGTVLTTVTVSGRDPRTASSGSCTVTAPAAARPDGAHPVEPRQDVLKPAVTSVTAPKSILAKPSSSPEPRYLLPVPPPPRVSLSESRSPPEGDTTLFLSRLSTIWKGFINMQSVAKFVTKAYPVSGCCDYLSEDLPDTIHIGGRITPRTVWDYVGKLKSSVSKELCLIRFHPATEEEEVAYISLYSYFSSRGRFGVVANNSRHVKDLYLIPLSAKDPIPSKLLPFEGPGLESPRPNIILGLVICQRIKRPSNSGELDKVEEKRTRPQTQEETEVSVYPKVPVAPQSERKPPKFQVGSGDVTVTAPASKSVLKILSSLKPGAASTVPTAPAATAMPAAAPSANSSTSKTASPLEHILQTLFGKKKSFDPPAREPAESAPASQPESKAKADGGLPAAPLLDPIVQQFGQFSKDRALEDEEDDRPYDPEEEYGPERAFDTELERGRRPDVEKAPDAAEREEVAYDPEDETILEEAKVAIDDLPNRMCADGKGGPTERPGEPAAPGAAPSLVEQQKMIEELNKQIEEQKRQVEEQEARERSSSPVPPPADGGPPSVGSGSTPRPARKVLLPTPPSTAFQPGFPLQNDGQSFPSPGGRDPFSGAACTSQEKPLGSTQYEDPRNAPFAEKGDHSAVELEGDREPQCRAGEGAAPFPSAGQRGGAPPPPSQGQREPAPRTFGTSGLHGPNFPGPRGPVPPFSEENIVSNSDGPRGPPPARFGAQKGPIPSLFSGPHGPSPYGDSRGPSPSHLGGPRGAAPPQFEERKDPHGEKREFQDSPYDETAGPAPPFEGPEQAQFMGSRGTAPFQFGGQRRPLLSQFKGPRGGPTPSQFGGQRGPPPGHFVGPRGPHPSQFEGPRGQAPNFMPGPRGIQPQQFEEQRVSSPPRFANPRAPAPLPFGGPRGSVPFPEKSEPTPPRFHYQGPPAPGLKPAPRPLLELPSHPPPHRPERRDEAPTQGPEADFREGKGHDYRTEAEKTSFLAGQASLPAEHAANPGPGGGGSPQKPVGPAGVEDRSTESCWPPRPCRSEDPSSAGQTLRTAEHAPGSKTREPSGLRTSIRGVSPKCRENGPPFKTLSHSLLLRYLASFVFIPKLVFHRPHKTLRCTRQHCPHPATCHPIISPTCDPI